MTIRIYDNRIEFTNTTSSNTANRTLTITPTGLSVSGRFTAREISRELGSFQGTVAGFNSGGYNVGFQNVVDKFPFATNSNATDVGDLTQSRVGSAGQSSSTHGYAAGGEAAPANSNTIDKFAFANIGNATDVGDLTGVAGGTVGQSSTTQGYTSGGVAPGTGVINTINKFPFATDTNATNIGSITVARRFAGGQSSTTHGYTSGAFDGPGGTSSYLNTIDKFPFAADTNATDVGDLTISRAHNSGQSSTTHGYNSGGLTASPPVTLTNTIDKFPFSTDTNATDVGDLLQTRRGTGGQSSTVSGYSSGGYSTPITYRNTVDKFPFSSDTNASDVGNISLSRTNPCGQQF